MVTAVYGLDPRGKLTCEDEELVSAQSGVAVIRKGSHRSGDDGLGFYEITVTPHCRTLVPGRSELAHATIYVLEGTMAIRLGDRTITVDAGDLVRVPVGVSCAAWNPTSATVRCLAIVADPRRDILENSDPELTDKGENDVG